MALRNIKSFEQDEESHWVARLSCGHTQHVRHHPPLESRTWVTTASGRQEKLGAELDCLFCDMPTLPSDVEVYKSTKTFNEASIPAGLTHKHTTKAGTWGRIIIEEGRLLYEILFPETSAGDASRVKNSWVLRSGVVGIVAPEEPHQVRAVGPVSFHVEFLR